jgi:hypothetical protein
MKDSSSHLVILVVLVCLLVGGAALYLRKLGQEDAQQISGSTFTTIVHTPVDEDWGEVVHLVEEDSTLIVEGRRLVAEERFMLRAQLVGPKGELLFSEEFPAGRGVTIRSGGTSKRSEGGPGLVELFCSRSTDGSDRAVQYYRVIRNRVVLVRVEDSQGRLVHDSTIGPKVPLRSLEAWEVSLASPDPGEVLWALRASGGGKNLTTSANPWIAEAAKAGKDSK